MREPGVTKDSTSEGGKAQVSGSNDEDQQVVAKPLTRRRFNRLASILLASLTLPAASLTMAKEAVIRGVRLWRAPGKTRFVFDMDRAVQHRAFSLDNPNRIVVDILNTQLTGPLTGLDFNGTPISSARWGRHNGSDLRIVFDVKGKPQPHSFALPPNATYGHRLVVDLFDDEQANQKPKPAPVPDTRNNRDIIVAIDAGHGGEDPGAIGHRGAREKDVVLAIAKEVEALFKKAKGFTPVLIRTGDYYISLRGRTQLAREKGADVFISIHADAFTRPSASGSSVFTLSEKGASSETARWLADKENSADMIGGEDGFSLDSRDDDVARLLLNLSATDTQIRSDKIGMGVLRELGRVNRLHKRKVEQATFAVLKNLGFPSILVETGFITNPDEATRLTTKTHQRRLANAIFVGVREFFESAPPVGTWVANNRNASQSGKIYKVRSGDTLSDIAQKNNVSLSRLLTENNLESRSVIRVGQAIRIP